MLARTFIDIVSLRTSIYRSYSPFCRNTLPQLEFQLRRMKARSSSISRPASNVATFSYNLDLDIAFKTFKIPDFVLRAAVNTENF